jgi:hypothetical protein
VKGVESTLFLTQKGEFDIDPSHFFVTRKIHPQNFEERLRFQIRFGILLEQEFILFQIKIFPLSFIVYSTETE